MDVNQTEPVGGTQDAAANPSSGKPALIKRDPFGLLVLILGAGAGLWGLLASFGSGWGFWDYTVGLTWLRYAFFLALFTLALGIGVFVWRRRKGMRTKMPRLLVGMLSAAIFAGYIGYQVSVAKSLPAIHDISTDLADPPQFVALQLRADNWDAIPGADDGDMQGLSPRQRWALLHQEAYPDIRSVRVNMPVADVIAAADRLAQDRDWDVVAAVQARGRLEATDTVSAFRFKDDVVLRVRPAAGGEGSIIDMRSVSRVGQSDIGVNAERVRSFLSDLSGTTTTAANR
ncbi:DUF1499 domain-containing protein [Novosphingopyxis baekryungensis]|uniref:DUF1499 domain-containing protein n=1 Tax=Novosphingopyxis baekryungensis TaxID=279369 RepID=UPI0003B51F9C|nr:DUF1499 domain-containing protein [Novosphingopyxis baekryungensis]